MVKDSDAEGASLSAVLDSDPAHGALTLRPDGSFDYKPVRGFAGTDTFFYRASDGVEVSAPVEVTITIKPLPLIWLPLLLDD